MRFESLQKVSSNIAPSKSAINHQLSYPPSNAYVGISIAKVTTPSMKKHTSIKIPDSGKSVSDEDVALEAGYQNSALRS
jgi:hypothetical protein